jgi:DNA-binding MarR family transcriptional regulator
MHAPAAPPHVSPAELAQELNRLWMHLMRAGTPRLYAVLDELDLPMAHVKALHALEGARGEVSVKDYAGQIGCSLPNASRMAEALLKRGFAERREDDDDRRIRRLRITEAGRDAVRRIDTARLEGLEAYTSGMTAEQRSALYAALIAIPQPDPDVPEDAR